MRPAVARFWFAFGIYFMVTQRLVDDGGLLLFLVGMGMVIVGAYKGWDE
jgi:hypothetical protein